MTGSSCPDCLAQAPDTCCPWRAWPCTLHVCAAGAALGVTRGSPLNSLLIAVAASPTLKDLGGTPPQLPLLGTGEKLIAL
jgi:hypothetical protein